MKRKTITQVFILILSLNASAQDYQSIVGTWICFDHPDLYHITGSDNYEDVEKNEELLTSISNFTLFRFEEFSTTDTAGMLLILSSDGEFNLMPFYRQHFERKNPNDEVYPVGDPMEMEIEDPEHSQWTKTISFWLRYNELKWKLTDDKLLEIFKKEDETPIVKFYVTQETKDSMRVSTIKK